MKVRDIAYRIDEIIECNKKIETQYQEGYSDALKVIRVFIREDE